MSEKPTRALLTDDDLDQLGLTREVADRIADAVDEYGPLTDSQANRLAVLLRPDPTEHLARGA